jgi:acetyltransferase-like isoleucine patch superfamily enzyme
MSMTTADLPPSLDGKVPSPAWLGWLLSGDQSEAVEKLKRKVARNLHLGWDGFLLKGLGFVRATVASRIHLRAVTSLGLGTRISGRPPVFESPAGTIVLGDDIHLVAPVTAIHIAVAPGGTLTLGDECWVNDGAWFGCTDRVTIGRRVLIGPGVRILDNDYHDQHDRRRVPPGQPVTIEDDVWLATGATILKGVTVGRGAIVGAGAVVHSDVAPFTVVVGNPARCIRTLDASSVVSPPQR